jgi:large subunit ribosomal protein L7/L12
MMWALSAVLVQEAEERDPSLVADLLAALSNQADGFQVGAPRAPATSMLRAAARAPLGETVMAVPKKRTSKMKTRSRKANWFAKARRQASLALSRGKSAGYDPLEDPKYSFSVTDDEEEDDDDEEEPARAGQPQMVARAPEPQMSGRRNLKKEKRVRNRVNAFRFKKPVPRFWNNRRNGPVDPKNAQMDAEHVALVFTKTAEEAEMLAQAAKEAPKEDAPKKEEARSPDPVMMLAEELAEELEDLAAAALEAGLEAAEDTAELLLAMRRSNGVAPRAGVPAMSAVDEVMDALKSMTLLEASELVKQIEETFDVDASVGGGMMMAAPMAGGAVAGGADAGAAEEKTEFDLVLESFPADKKIAVLKVVRELTGMGLKDAKDKVESAPCALKEGASKAECEEAVKKLEDAGATAALK